MDIDELRAAMQNAQSAHITARDAYSKERRLRIEAATKVIDADMAEELKAIHAMNGAAYDAQRAYETAYAEAQASASFTLADGTTLKAGDVVSMVETSWQRRNTNKVLTGLVEVVNHSTRFPENTAKWNKPKIGDFIVRIRTVDGKIGIRFNELRNNSPWMPVK